MGGGAGSLKIFTGVLVHRVTRPLRGSVSCGSGWSVPCVSIQLTLSQENLNFCRGGSRTPPLQGKNETFYSIFLSSPEIPFAVDGAVASHLGSDVCELR